MTSLETFSITCIYENLFVLVKTQRHNVPSNYMIEKCCQLLEFFINYLQRRMELLIRGFLID
jgi:hypothetical protein